MSAPDIHPSAVVHPGASIADGCRIGPFCVVGDNVMLSRDVVLHSHVVVEGRTCIGQGTVVYPFAALGHAPQDLKYAGEDSSVDIGAHCSIREYVTVHPGTRGGQMQTRVGDGCLLMLGVHIAHDCRVGDGVIMANNATLAGHVTVGDHAVLGGLCAVHQFVRIGAHAMIGGLAGVERDVIPFGTVMGERAHLAGLNIVGLKRHGFGRKDIHDMRAAYRELFENADGGETMAQRMQTLGEAAQGTPLANLRAFLQADSKRAYCLPAAGQKN